MADYFLVERGKGPAWDHSRARREQAGWDEHAAFMDGLVDEGKIILGGPLEDVRYTMHIVEASSEQDVRNLFATDPWWVNGMLRPVSVERWTILLDGRD
jgi:uncharacterized protein YciI